MAAGYSDTQQSHPHSPLNVSPRRKPSQQLPSHCEHSSQSPVTNIPKSASLVESVSKRLHTVFFFFFYSLPNRKRGQPHRKKNWCKKKIKAEKRQDDGRHSPDMLVRNSPRDIWMAWTGMGWWRRESCCCRLCPQFPAKSRRKTLHHCLNSKPLVPPKQAFRASVLSLTSHCQCCLWWRWFADVLFMSERENLTTPRLAQLCSRWASGMNWF